VTGIASSKDGQWSGTILRSPPYYTIPRDRQYYYGINSRGHSRRRRRFYNSKITTGRLCIRRPSRTYNTC